MEGWDSSRPEDQQGGDALELGGGAGARVRVVHRAPSPASGGGPQLINNRGLPGSREEGEVEEERESQEGEE